MIGRYKFNLVLLVLILTLAAGPLSCANQEAVPAADKAVKTEAVKSEVPAATAPEPIPANAEVLDKKTTEDKNAKKPQVFVLELHQPAPAIELVDIDGQPVTLEDFRGKPLLMSFWDTSCKVCVSQIKTLKEKMKEKNADIEILMVSPGVVIKDQQNHNPEAKEDKKEPTPEENEAKKRDALDMLKKEGIDARVAFDDTFKTSSFYQIRGIPYNVLIDAEGNLQAAGRLLVNQKMNTMTFLDMALKVAGGGDVPTCEFAQTRTPEAYKDLIGKEAPPFKGLDVDGNEHALSFYRNFSNVLLVFWSPTCGHCRAELPRLNLFLKKYGEEKNTKIVGIVSLPEREKADKYVSIMKQLVDVFDLTFPMVLDYGQKIQAPYKVQGVPSMFLVNREGIIVEAFSGEALFAAEGLNCVIDRMEEK